MSRVRMPRLCKMDLASSETAGVTMTTSGYVAFTSQRLQCRTSAPGRYSDLVRSVAKAALGDMLSTGRGVSPVASKLVPLKSATLYR